MNLAQKTSQANLEFVFDPAATQSLRAQLRAQRTAPLPLIDRGAGHEKMLRGEFNKSPSH